MTIKGREAMRRHLLEELPKQIEAAVRGAVRVGANVIAKEARARCISDEVRGSIKVRVAPDEGTTVTARIQTIGKGSYIAPWLEYGTSPHFITVAKEQRGGLSVGAINRQGEKGALAIGGNFVSGTVRHPGARKEPFLRPAVDHKEKEAFAAAQTYLDKRLGKGGAAQIEDD